MTARAMALVVLVAGLAELMGLLVLRRVLAPRLSARAVVLMLCPGLALMVALVLATRGVEARWVAVALLAALALHLADLRSRAGK